MFVCICSIDPSLYSVSPDLVITGRVRSTVSIRLFIVPHRIFSSLFMCRSDPLVLVLLRRRTPTDDTSIPSSDRGIDN